MFKGQACILFASSRPSDLFGHPRTPPTPRHLPEASSATRRSNWHRRPRFNRVTNQGGQWSHQWTACMSSTLLAPVRCQFYSKLFKENTLPSSLLDRWMIYLFYGNVLPVLGMCKVTALETLQNRVINHSHVHGSLSCEHVCNIGRNKHSPSTKAFVDLSETNGLLLSGFWWICRRTPRSRWVWQRKVYTFKNKKADTWHIFSWGTNNWLVPVQDSRMHSRIRALCASALAFGASTPADVQDSTSDCGVHFPRGLAEVW